METHNASLFCGFPVLLFYFSVAIKLHSDRVTKRFGRVGIPASRATAPASRGAGALLLSRSASSLLYLLHYLKLRESSLS